MRGYLSRASDEHARIASLAEWLLPRADALHEGAVLPDLAGCPLGAAERARLLAGPQFGQILNDLRVMRQQVTASTPTIDFLRRTVSPANDLVLLDAGCSVGRHLYEIAPLAPGRLVGLDVDSLALQLGARLWPETGRPPVEWAQASILDIPFATGSFSHAITGVTLSEVPVRQALAELARVIRPRGQLVLTVEGPGFWRKGWDAAPPWSVARLQWLRCRLGNSLMRAGLDWQHGPARRLAGLMQFDPATASRLLCEAGFRVVTCEILTRYRGEPLLLGLEARRA